MAKQAGIMPLEGSLGNYTFYKTKDGYRVRVRGGVSAGKIASDPKFQRTRENNEEFKQACIGSKVLRFGLRQTIGRAKDSFMISRLTAAMLKVLQADSVSNRGSRTVSAGNVVLLQGFEFNSKAKLSATLLTAYKVAYDRTSGTASITVEAFVPANSVRVPQGTTHFQLFASACSVSFTTGDSDTGVMSSGELEYGDENTGDIILPVTIGKDSKNPVCILLGIEFMQQVNGKMYPLQNGLYNACSVIRVYNALA